MGTHHTYKKTQKTLREGNIVKSISVQKVKEENKKIHKTHFVGSSENPICHVRPHGADFNDQSSLPVQDKLTGYTSYEKQCFWIDTRFINAVLHGEESEYLSIARNRLSENGKIIITGENDMAKYKSIDLFAGIGGIRLGFDYAFKNEIETVFVSEWDEYAQKTYRANFDDPFEIAGDITKINEKDIPDFDICLAGFPCQAFSLAGKRLGFNDDYKGLCRGTLFMDVARICEYHKPKVIFCENVKGLTIHDHGKTFKVITQTFESLGYKIFYKILNSKDFGVPQNRERIYIVCFRNDVAPVNFEFPEAQEKKVCLRDVLDEAPVPSKYYLSDTYVETLKRHKARHQALGHGFGYEIRDLNGIAGTIVCGGMGKERNLIIDTREHSMTPTTHIKGDINGQGIRKLTPREWCRLQGFPDDFKLPLADTHMYKQFGNSVTVPVIEAIAKKIKGVLDSGKQ